MMCRRSPTSPRPEGPPLGLPRPRAARRGTGGAGRTGWGLLAALGVLAWTAGAAAAPPSPAAEPPPSPTPEPTPSPAPESPREGEPALAPEDEGLELPTYRTVVRARTHGLARDPQRAGTRITHDDLDQRKPRSAPEALRWEPGVYVQQTAAGQGSPYLRGMTGQQTVMLFDGVRINNSLFRQGPNQYFFTIDPYTLQSIEVQRGSASVLYGSDALGGVLLAQPRSGPPAASAPDGGAGQLLLKPRLFGRWGSADDERGGRVELGAAWGQRVSVLAGLSARRAGLLESAGELEGVDGGPALVPRLAEDGRTQLGTGYDEVAGDLLVDLALSPTQSLRTAAFLYRQYDAPRTDRCPSAYAPSGECMTYDEQFRTLTYLAWSGRGGQRLRRFRVLASYQRQHERRSLERPYSSVHNGGRDDLDTFAFSARAESQPLRLRPWLALLLSTGLDASRDQVASQAWIGFTDMDFLRYTSRGQYLDGSSYATGATFAQAEVLLGQRLALHGGGRVSGSAAWAPEDPESGTEAVDRGWLSAVGDLGLRLSLVPGLDLLANLDQGFRAPNLDDLTSRQQTGPGFQFENAGLEPERSLTRELGLRLQRSRLEGEVWVFRSTVEHAITRRTEPSSACPAGTSGEDCRASWHRYRLTNAADESLIWGAEAYLRARLPGRVTLRGSVSYAWGEGPNPTEPGADSTAQGSERVPLSRIPPTNGTGELSWDVWPSGPRLTAALRWALAQDRLAITDLSDPRIPPGGTPGYAVVDLRASYKVQPWLGLNLVAENLGDVVYRHHGSSLNGPGRSLIVAADVGL